jgi:hypothetical protein
MGAMEEMGVLLKQLYNPISLEMKFLPTDPDWFRIFSEYNQSK